MKFSTTLIITLLLLSPLCHATGKSPTQQSTPPVISTLPLNEQEELMRQMKKADNYRYMPKEIIEKIKLNTILGKKQTPETKDLFNKFEKERCNILYLDDEHIIFLHTRDRSVNNKNSLYTFIQMVPRKIRPENLLFKRKPFKVSKAYFPIEGKYASAMKKEGSLSRMSALAFGLNQRLQSMHMAPAIKLDVKKSSGKIFDIPVILTNSQEDFDKWAQGKTLASLKDMDRAELCRAALGAFVNSLVQLPRITEKNGIKLYYVMDDHITVILDIDGNTQHDANKLPNTLRPYTASGSGANFKRIKTVTLSSAVNDLDDHDLYPIGIPSKRYALDMTSAAEITYAKLMHNFTLYYRWVEAQQEEGKPSAEFEQLTRWYHALNNYYRGSCLISDKAPGKAVYGQYSPYKTDIFRDLKTLKRKGVDLGKAMKFTYDPEPRESSSQ